MESREIRMEMGPDGVWGRRLGYRERVALSDSTYRPHKRRYTVALSIVTAAQWCLLALMATALEAGLVGDAALCVLAWRCLPFVLAKKPDWREHLGRVPRVGQLG